MRNLRLTASEWLVFLSIVAVSAVLRLYQLPQLYHFAGDQGRDAMVMAGIISGAHFPLRGPSSSVGNFNLGPFFYYFMAPSLAIAGMNPVGPAIFEALLGVLATVVLFVFGKRVQSVRFGSLLAISYALSPIFITYDRFAWNPNSIPLFFVLSMWYVYEYLRKPVWQWLVGVILMLGILVQLHLVMLPLVLIAVLLIWWKNNKLNTHKKILFSGLLGLILIVSLFPFVKSILGGMGQSQFIENNPVNIPSHVLYILTFLFTSVGNGQIVVSLVIMLATIIGGYFLLKLDLKFAVILLLPTGLIIISLTLLQKLPETHYLLVPFTAILFLTMLAFERGLQQIAKAPLRRVVMLAGSGLLILIWLPHIRNIYFAQDLKVDQIIRTDQLIDDQDNNQPFQLAALAKTDNSDPYAYFLLMKHAQVIRNQGIENQLFIICEPTVICDWQHASDYEITRFLSAHASQTIIVTQLSANPILYKLSATP